ncbi:MAG: GTP-binding protein [Euryarchaeota archaeon]|nr:GTP-binding protein [Euryarchaeota archaeon]
MDLHIPLLLVIIAVAALAAGAWALRNRRSGAGRGPAAELSAARPGAPPAEPADGPSFVPAPPGFSACQKKIALIGDGGVGKTSLVNRFVKGHFDDRYIHTIGTNVKKKPVLLPEEKAEITLMVWDMQGQRNDPTVMTHMFRSEGAIVVCDVTRDQTFNSIPEWIALLEKELGHRVPMVLLGNKADLEEQSLIGQSQLQYMASRYGASWHLTSAKTGQNVEEAFTELARRTLSGK